MIEKINQMLHETVTKDSHWLSYNHRQKKTFLIFPQKNSYLALHTKHDYNITNRIKKKRF